MQALGHYSITSTRIPQLPEARWNPGAAKASDSEVSRSFCAFARGCDETRYPLEAPLIDVCSEAATHRLCCGRVASRVFVNRNCGIRVELSLAANSANKKGQTNVCPFEIRSLRSVTKCCPGGLPAILAEAPLATACGYLFSWSERS